VFRRGGDWFAKVGCHARLDAEGVLSFKRDMLNSCELIWQLFELFRVKHRQLLALSAGTITSHYCFGMLNVFLVATGSLSFFVLKLLHFFEAAATGM